jgi:hypothetical protein
MDQIEPLGPKRDVFLDGEISQKPTIYIFKFITGLFKPTTAVWRCLQVEGGCGYGPDQVCECSDEAKDRWIRQGCKEFRVDLSERR